MILTFNLYKPFYFNPFVIPFLAGMLVLSFLLLKKYFRWLRSFSSDDRQKIKKGILSWKIFAVVKEVFLESLLHRKIFRANPLLGYMHMSLAFGWFLMIVAGIAESKMHSQKVISMPYEAVFFRYFVHDKAEILPLFLFLMDLLLLFVLSGVALAFVKRINSRVFGMKKTTKLKPADKLALYALWMIFPFRLLAESTTAGIYNNGGFLTNNVGYFLSKVFPLQTFETPLWWLYSLALGTFFVCLPGSRYMHIPTEVLLIFLRKAGVGHKGKYDAFSEIEVNSCPRCGICIDKCQLNSSLDIKQAPSVYFLKSVRENEEAEKAAFNCLMCGRCKEVCPVGIDTLAIRHEKRREDNISPAENPFPYLKNNHLPKAEVAYFAGCMTHLQPGIKKSMTKILERANISYVFVDKDGGACCGRPMALAGRDKEAEALVSYNKRLIERSGAKILVTSCPICLKTFKEDYNLDLEVLHHSQYLLRLARGNKLSLNFTNKSVAYHDPCELGRGLNIYQEPRELLSSIMNLAAVKQEKAESLCCGGSLGNILISEKQRRLIKTDVVSTLTADNPDIIVTGCPMCKRTLNSENETEVMDLAEVLASSLNNQ